MSATPGPWHCDDNPDSTEVLTSDGVCVAQAIDPQLNRRSMLPWDEVQANRHLIATAPELYSALRDFTEWVETLGEAMSPLTRRQYEAAHAALMKGEGKS